MRLGRKKGRQDGATSGGDAPGRAGPEGTGAPAGGPGPGRQGQQSVPGPGRQDGTTSGGDAPGLAGPGGNGAPAGVPGPGRQDEHRVVVYSREGCHLCEAAEQVVAAVVAETGDSWERVDVDADPELVARFNEQVPVTFVDGRQHDFWRVDPVRLRAALSGRR